MEGVSMKKVFVILATLSFFYVLGVVGAMEQSAMNIRSGMIQMVSGLFSFWLFMRLAGGVNCSYTYDEGEDDE